MMLRMMIVKMKREKKRIFSFDNFLRENNLSILWRNNGGERGEIKYDFGEYIRC